MISLKVLESSLQILECRCTILTNLKLILQTENNFKSFREPFIVLFTKCLKNYYKKENNYGPKKELFPSCFVIMPELISHWKPNWQRCNPCVNNYDYILKMETYERDTNALNRKVNNCNMPHTCLEVVTSFPVIVVRDFLIKWELNCNAPLKK